eukprot:TRINITY_DN17898_c0_g3_i1.p1 TRINITY_DN17898_c0_g3~~TRINITY_DN17898_c0_g3_i1.p1  ORF type:complete len:1143 (+),score=393.35 TRINITY_DN17898_c0_g3_i1:28-3429(+)
MEMEYFTYLDDSLKKEKKRKKGRKRDDARSLQEELRLKLEEQERLRDELEEIRSQSHTSYERRRDVVDEPSWSDTTGSPNRTERSRTVPPSDITYQPMMGFMHSTLQHDDVDERYRQRLARLERMVLTDEQNMLQKEESLRTQLAEKEQLLRRFETELTRCNPIPPSQIAKEDKVPISPGDTPPNNSLSPTHESPGAAKPLPYNYSKPTNNNNGCEMFSLGMQAFESVTNSPTPLQKIAASPPRLVKTSFGTQTEDEARTQEMQTQTQTQAHTQAQAEESLPAAKPQSVGHRPGVHQPQSSKKPDSLRREDYPEGHEGDDMWMKQVESVVQGSRSHKGSPTRSRKVSFSSPPAAVVSPAHTSAFTKLSPESFKHPATPSVTPIPEAFESFPQTRTPSSRPPSPATPVPDPLTPSGKDSILSAVCEKVIPLFGSAVNVERRSITPVTAPQDTRPVEARCVESENKLEHYTLLVKQFEDTVLRLSGCVEKKTAEVKTLEEALLAKSEECDASNVQWQATYDSCNEQWQAKYNNCDEQWQQRYDALDSEWDARMQQSLTEQQTRHTDASAEIARLNSAIKSLCANGDEDNAYAALEERFAEFTSNMRKDMQSREAAWREVHERSTTEICRLQGDLASCQEVILEREAEIRSFAEKLAELTKEVDGKEGKIQSLLAKQHQLSNEIEQKQDMISEMQLTYAQYKDTASSDEIREMVMELKHDYMKLYEERKTRDDQEVKDFYAFCKEQMELKEAKLEEGKQQAMSEAQGLLARQHGLKNELAELQHRYDVAADRLREEQTMRQQEAQEYKLTVDKLRQDVAKISAKKGQLEKSLSLLTEGSDGRGMQQVFQLQHEIENLARTKQSKEIEYQGIIDSLKKDLHEKELQLSAFQLKQTNTQQMGQELQQRSNELEAAQRQLSELTRIVEEKTSALQYAEQRMKEEYQRQYHDLQQVQGQFGQYEGEVSVLKAQLAETQAMAEKCKAEMEATQQRAASQEAFVRELSRERDCLKEQLEWGSQQGLAQLQAHQQQYRQEPSAYTSQAMTPQSSGHSADGRYMTQNTVPPVPPAPTLPMMPPAMSPHMPQPQADNRSSPSASPPTMASDVQQRAGAGKYQPVLRRREALPSTRAPAPISLRSA